MAEVQSHIPGVQGFKVAGIHAGLKANGAEDMALVYSDLPCVAAGVFTTNTVKAAPVLVDMEKLAAHSDGYHAVIVNTRCANACTGEIGIVNANAMANHTADALKVIERGVLVMSTGVIGTHLNMEKIAGGISLAVSALGDDWEKAARGIMTTDTRPKSAYAEVTLSAGTVRIAGISKGAGMIAPNMATMLGVIVTDAGLTASQAQAMLSKSAELTFNRIVVDGDMSTNDTVVMLANGASGVSITSDADCAAFEEALQAVSRKLAQDIVRDGEGVTKFITLHITGAASNADAKQIANTIATSPLVKTAFFGGDPNWGRIVAAAGRSGAKFEPANARLWLAEGEELTRDLLLFEAGMPTAYDEDRAAELMRASSVVVSLDCGLGSDEAVVWTCDLSHDYVSINGHYRT